MEAQRLLTLAKFLRTVPEDKFDISTWASTGKLPTECGFAGCAVGWAGAIPEFNKAGFTVVRDKNDWPDEAPSPHFEDETNWNAVELFFDLTFTEAQELFDEGAYDYTFRRDDVTPNEVAEKIEDFVAEAQA